MKCPEFPTEIWTMIIEDLPEDSQVSVFHVSRALHSIALRSLFSNIKIYLLNTRYVHYMDDNASEADHVITLSPRLMKRSWEILEYITRSPEFARVVKTMNVIACSDSQAVFEQMSLGKALRAMPNLRKFYWFGVHPEFSESIAQSLPPSLRSLTLQTFPPISVLPSLPSLTHFQSLTPIYSSFGMVDDCAGELDWHIPSDRSQNFISIIENITSAPEYLTIIDKHMGYLPIRAYDALTDLDICFTPQFNDSCLDMVFHHAPLLESLSIIGHISEDIFLMLPQSTVIMPRLKSFRISCPAMPFQLGAASISVFAQFLTGRPLERLSVRLPVASWDSISLLLPVLDKLTISGFWDYIPEFRILALHLDIPWDLPYSTYPNPSPFSHLIQRLSQLPHLTFLHFQAIHGYFSMPAEDIISELPQLRTLGLHHFFWDIWDVGDPTINESPRLVPWAPWKVKFSVDEDFRCADDAWLARYR
ncbi:hypothetical protein BD779DRAFT_1670779 [Infundibulicybe gibba]|nr:hypothetical protein BD779DRAFT_1670779 [Infundibulicybe gibba]